MKFSIITVVYNGKKTIEGTISSVLSQSFNDYEYIVIDGGSDDGTLDVLSEYEVRLSALISERDNGVYDAMNKGLNMAKGDYICFLNCGDFLFDETTLSHVSKMIEMNNGYDIYYGRAVVSFPNGNECWQVCGDVSNNILNRKEVYLSEASIGGDIIHQSIFASRRCFDGNAFNTTYRIRAELDWYYGCIEKGYSFYNMNMPICRYTYGGISEDIDSINKGIDETRMIISGHGYDYGIYDRSMEKRYVSAQMYKVLYSKWLEAIHEGKSIAQYLKDNNISDIAIYGYGELGTHLMSELRGSQINVRYFLDRGDKYEYQETPCYKPDPKQEYPKVDAVINTVIQFKKSIEETCAELGFVRTIPLDEIIEELLLD